MLKYEPSHIVHGGRNRIVPNYVPLVGLKKIIVPPVMLVRDWTVGSVTKKRNLSLLVLICATDKTKLLVKS